MMMSSPDILDPVPPSAEELSHLRKLRDDCEATAVIRHAQFRDRYGQRQAHGYVYHDKHGRFGDGSWIHTSKIVQEDYDADANITIVDTHSGNTYVLLHAAEDSPKVG